MRASATLLVCHNRPRLTQQSLGPDRTKAQPQRAPNRCRVLLFGFVTLVGPSWATAPQALKFELPIACEIGPVCQIQNHFDHEAGPGFRDYACGTLGYDGHKGTDIRLPNLAVMEHGIAVLAAAPGRVRAIRDEMPDRSIREPGQLDAIRGREAGNAVAIDHGNGWETQYSHLRRRSVRVRPGDEVAAGAILGLVGLSGKTEFPHLHFEVRYQGTPVDPFVGREGVGPCGQNDRQPLWTEKTGKALTYRPTGLLQAGFAGEAPDLARVEAGAYDATSLPGNIEAVVFWAEVFGVRRGDHETLTVYRPDGEILVKRQRKLEKDQARWFSYIGKRLRGPAWPKGVYRAEYRLMRPQSSGGETLISSSRQIELK